MLIIRLIYRRARYFFISLRRMARLMTLLLINACTRERTDTGLTLIFSRRAIDSMKIETFEGVRNTCKTMTLCYRSRNNRIAFYLFFRQFLSKTVSTIRCISKLSNHL